MTADKRFVSERFPRSSGYHPEWIIASASGGANALWMTEWLTGSLDLRPGMRVLASLFRIPQSSSGLRPRAAAFSKMFDTSQVTA